MPMLPLTGLGSWVFEGICCLRVSWHRMGEAELGLRARKKAKTKLLIQQQAQELFRAKGFDATTVAEIAAAAEISEPTFFRYFGSKVAVAIVPLSDLLDLVLDLVASRPTDEGPIEAALNVARHAATAEAIPGHDVAREIRALIANDTVTAGVLTLFDNARGRLAVEFAPRLGALPSDAISLQTAGVVIAVALGAARAWIDTPDDDGPITATIEGLERLQSGLR